jgi:DNA polymerase-3 subunit delta'
VSNSADRLLPTIISRTQIVTVPLLGDDELAGYLQQHNNTDPERAAKVAQLADGNINLAFRLLEKVEDNSTQWFTDWMRACFGRKYMTLVNQAEEYHGLDKLSQRNRISYGMNMMRESLLHVSGAGTINRTRGNELKFIQDFSKVLTLDKVEKTFKLMNEASYHLERNGSAKMIFLDLSLKLSRTLNP